MAKITDKELEAIHETHDAVIRLVTLMDGENGISATLRNHGKRIRRIELIGVGLMTSGALGTGIMALVNSLGK